MDRFTREAQELRRELAALHNKFPGVFDEIIREVGKEGLPPTKNNTLPRSNSVPENAYYLLLAKYRVAQENSGEGKIIRDQFLRESVGHWAKNKFNSKEWNNFDTLDGALKRAERLEKEDPEFAEKVRLATLAKKYIGVKNP